MHKISICLILTLFSLTINAGEILEGRVVGVHDGDTVTLLMAGNQQIKIRLAQIDAPESDQAFGQKSKQSLSDMVFNKAIKVDKDTIDKYGRTVGTIIVEGMDANREQIKRGMAWAYTQYLHDQSLIQVEKDAREAKVGLWSDSNPTPPWEYRHGKKISAVHQAAPEVNTAINASNPSCGSKRYCKEMSSCEEAKFYLTQCGLTRLDGDHDGAPCESLCGHGR
ncbi:MAG: thermonuclease family protein [Methylobacter sp.]|uniref:thermonuclease family protein n=1 Tax=Methylobacter sp. TaxID=2051955 RepID=UPI00272F9713|nr:thermonuclease family protein [Methylobacter sp.]MDP1666140.1 thermonuclease family protein [Methylobacter sp.]